jgi:hypothetical protein
VQPIIVSNLIVESVAGATCYPDEGGFSALTAYVKPDDPETIDRLRRAANEGARVIVRCAKLEIEGRVGNLDVSIGGMIGAIAIAIDELRYFKHGRQDRS